jgi:hypothetical protein
MISRIGGSQWSDRGLYAPTQREADPRDSTRDRRARSDGIPRAFIACMPYSQLNSQLNSKLHRKLFRALSTTLLAGLLLAATERTARAEEAVADPEDRTVTRWYGYQTLATDAASIALGAASASVGPTRTGDALGVLALSSYLAGGPTAHFARGFVAKGFGDLAVRIGAPLVCGLVGGMISSALYEPPPQPEPQNLEEAVTNGVAGAVAAEVGPAVAAVEGMYYGALVGAAVAMATDAAFLARERVQHEPRPQASAAPPSATIRPSIAPSRGGATAGIMGTF